jgi:hypothetical protein
VEELFDEREKWSGKSGKSGVRVHISVKYSTEVTVETENGL